MAVEQRQAECPPFIVVRKPLVKTRIAEGQILRIRKRYLLPVALSDLRKQELPKDQRAALLDFRFLLARFRQLAFEHEHPGINVRQRELFIHNKLT